MTDKRLGARGLQWQSQALVATVIPVCVAVVCIHSVRGWGASTRTALLFSTAFALSVWLARSATPLAAITGGVLTATMAFFPGHGDLFHSALLPLVALLLLTLGATRFGRRHKEGLGLAEARGGRNAAQVVANLGIAGLTASLALALSWTAHLEDSGLTFTDTSLTHFVSWNSLLSVALVAALAEATSDTLSSELGEVLGGEPFLITTGKRVAAGTDGAISVAGTVAGTLGGFAVLVVAVLAMRLNMLAAICAGVGAFAGFFCDSLLGATAERRSLLNNDSVNFLSTAAAALLSLLLFLIFST
jgi:uncharacterized protein (TIGR00297 family)